MQTLLLSCVLMLGALTGAAPNFPIDMFETTSHNFGTVVKGTKTEFDFVFTNKYLEDVVIESVTSSCQCTTPSFTQRGPIKTHQQGRIHISVNTQNFTGTKNATITVRFSKPYRTEMQLHSYVVIRNDVSVSPGIIYFGSVNPQTKPVQHVTVHSINPRWEIRDVQSNCKFLEVRLNRRPNTGYQGGSTYTMSVYLRENATPGPFSEVLEIITNDYDQRQQRIPVKVQGRVKQTLSASPSPLAFNIVEVGQKVEKILVLQGASPFKITDVTSESKNISASIEKEPKTIQRITLAYTGKEVGDFNGQFYIYTDLEGGMSVPVKFSGKVVPASEPEPEPALEETSEEKPTRPLDPPDSAQEETQESESAPEETPEKPEPQSNAEAEADEDGSIGEFQIEEIPGEESSKEEAETEDSKTPANASDEKDAKPGKEEADSKKPGEPDALLIPDEEKPEAGKEKPEAGKEKPETGKEKPAPGTIALEEAENLMELEPAENQSEGTREKEPGDSMDLLALPEQQELPGGLTQPLPEVPEENGDSSETANVSEPAEDAALPGELGEMASPEETDEADEELPSELILESSDEMPEMEEAEEQKPDADLPQTLPNAQDTLPNTIPAPSETPNTEAALPAEDVKEPTNDAAAPAMPQPKPAVIGRNLLKSKT